MTFFLDIFSYISFGDYMKVKIFDEESEFDLEEDINNFLSGDVDVFDIKYSVSSCIYGEEQIYCFSALVMYRSIN